MKNLPNETNKIDVQMHIDEGFKIIEEFLPVDYIDQVKKLLKDDSISSDSISNVRRKRTSTKKNLKVFKAIVEVALENKKEAQGLKHLITNK